MPTRTRTTTAQPTPTEPLPPAYRSTAPSPPGTLAPHPADTAAETLRNLHTLTQPPAPATASPTAAILAGALHLIEQRGWAATGRTCRHPSGALCLLGALRIAAGGTPNTTGSLDSTRAAAFLLDVIQDHFDADTLPSWNDTQPNGHHPTAMLRLATNRARTLGI